MLKTRERLLSAGAEFSFEDWKITREGKADEEETQNVSKRTFLKDRK